MAVSPPVTKPRILYVDDEQDNLRSFRALFRRDFDVHIADSAPEALRILQQESIDVLVSDQRMPGMTGVELLERVALDFPEILRYMLTGFSDYDPLVDAINNGRIQGYFAKPLNPDEIRDRIQRGLENLYLKARNDQLFEELKISEERFRTLFEQAADSIVLIDPHSGMLHDFNVITYTNLGYSREELQRIEVHQLAVEGSREEMKKHLAIALESGANTFAMQLEGKDGGLHDFLMKIKAVSIRGRTYLLGILNDITEQMRVQAELKESQGFLHAIIENIPDMIFVQHAKDLRFLKCNRAGEELLGYSRRELIGKTVYDLFPNEEADLLTQRDREVLGRCQVLEIPEETINTRNRGQRTFHTKKIPILDDGGRPQYLLGVSEDITEKVGLREREKKLEADLRQVHKMEAIGTLAGGIAHDFNNILGIVMGNAEIALFDTPKGSPTHAHLRRVVEASFRARDLVQQILIFSRRSEHEKKPLKIAPIIKEALKLLRSSLPSTIEIRQTLDVPEREDSVLADPTQIHQVLMNLGTNAYHAMRESGGVLEIEYSSVEFGSEDPAKPPDLNPGCHTVLTVRDTGHGMSREVMERIFEPYFTTKQQEEGTGLGLAVVHGIAKKHGGAITVTSTPGAGSTFRVFFPKWVGNVVKAEQETPSPLPGGMESILLVDDEPILLDAVSKMLELLGYAVVPKSSGVEALEEFRRKPDAFDLVITDQTMPKMTGLELSRQLISIRPDLPVILCTGFSDSRTLEKLEAAGVRALAMKPVIMNDIAGTIRKVLHGEESR